MSLTSRQSIQPPGLSPTRALVADVMTTDLVVAQADDAYGRPCARWTRLPSATCPVVSGDPLLLHEDLYQGPPVPRRLASGNN